MSKEPPRVFVLGSFVQACCAEVERLPLPGECLRATRFSAEPGGKGFNVAVGARRQGAHVDCLVAVGDDPFGALAETAFETADLAPHLIHRYPVPTGAGVGVIQADGETIVAVYLGANLSLSAADARDAAAQIARADIVTAQFEIADPPIVEAFAIARAAGRTTLLNPSPFRAPTCPLLAATSVVVVNVHEAADLAVSLGLEAGLLGPDAIVQLGEALFARGPECLVVTLGDKGALAYARDLAEPVRQPAFAVAAIDTLGAGDAFTAAFAVALAGGRPLAESLRRAAAAGAIMATRAGVFGGLPCAAEIDALLAI